MGLESEGSISSSCAPSGPHQLGTHVVTVPKLSWFPFPYLWSVGSTTRLWSGALEPDTETEVHCGQVPGECSGHNTCAGDGSLVGQRGDARAMPRRRCGAEPRGALGLELGTTFRGDPMGPQGSASVPKEGQGPGIRSAQEEARGGDLGRGRSPWLRERSRQGPS